MRKEFLDAVDMVVRHIDIDRFQSFFVNVTYKCPLACKYCYVNQGSKPDMTYEEIDYLVDRLVTGGAHLITFFGGEPALRIGDIDKVVRKHQQDDVHFGIITSFMVNRDKLTKLMADMPRFEVTISYDSPENEQRIYHSGKSISFDDVDFASIKGNINLLKVANGREKDFANDLCNFLDLCERYHIYGDVSDNKTPYDSMDYKKLKAGYEAYATRVMDDYLTGKLPYLPKHFVYNMLSFLRKNPMNMGGCGILQEIFISADGMISPCSISNMGKDLRLTDDDSYMSIRNLELSYLQNPECESCAERFFCNGGCLVDRFNVNKDYNKPNHAWCRYIRTVCSAYKTVFEKYKQLDPVKKLQMTDGILLWKTKHYEYCGTNVSFYEI